MRLLTMLYAIWTRISMLVKAKTLLLVLMRAIRLSEVCVLIPLNLFLFEEIGMVDSPQLQLLRAGILLAKKTT